MVRMRHYITLDCLKEPELASWMNAWLRGTDKNVLTTTSLTRWLMQEQMLYLSVFSICLLWCCRHSFVQFLERYQPYYDIPTYRPQGGRPRKLQNHHQVLGLLLAFYVDSMQRASLCNEIGVPSSTLTRVLNAPGDALTEVLRSFSPARIVWPTLERQQALARLVALRQPLLRYTWDF
ncbi:hypothetical protein GQ600_3259 [Phytophthora cactorum]|nr:hypothetical protein GQ600_3259 [Phytophthora cactorum]